MITDMNPEEIAQRIEAGKEAARDAKAKEHKPFGQTSEDNYPWTYWWIKGYNEQVDAT